MTNAPLAGRQERLRPTRRRAWLAPWPGVATFCLALTLNGAGGTARAETAPESTGKAHEARRAVATLAHAAPNSAGVAANPAGALSAFSLGSISAPNYWLHLDTGLPVSRDSLETHWRATVRPPDPKSVYSLSSTEAVDPWYHLAHSPASIELNPTHLLPYDPQRDYHPHLELGSSSDSLRSFLRDAGLNASTCIAPVMRMHSTVAGTGPRTNVSVSARCSFH